MPFIPEVQRTAACALVDLIYSLFRRYCTQPTFSFRKISPATEYTAENVKDGALSVTLCAPSCLRFIGFYFYRFPVSKEVLNEQIIETWPGNSTCFVPELRPGLESVSPINTPRELVIKFPRFTAQTFATIQIINPSDYKRIQLDFVI